MKDFWQSAPIGIVKIASEHASAAVPEPGFWAPEGKMVPTKKPGATIRVTPSEEWTTVVTAATWMIAAGAPVLFGALILVERIYR